MAMLRDHPLYFFFLVLESYKPLECYLTPRPWMDLYGVFIHPPKTSQLTTGEDLALIHSKIPEVILLEIFARLSPYTLGIASCVCKKWRSTIRQPMFWRAVCLKTWQIFSPQENKRMFAREYGGSWLKMWLHRPHSRFDGIYVSRNTYVRAGSAHHQVCYYRYIRFFPNGKFLYRNTSLKLKEVAKTLNRRASRENIYGGRYTLTNDLVAGAIVYPGRNPTVVRMLLRIRGTIAGANNRLDVKLLASGGLGEIEARMDEENAIETVQDWGEDETHNPDVPAVVYRNKVAPFVFVPFHEVETSVLNLPVEKMDYYIPG